ncbi:hypothetical protein ACFLZM_00580 [Thermodesulfobacteriota bacterium]
MSIEFGRDALYIAKASQRKGGKAEGINYGFLCITHLTLYYVPKHVLSTKRTGILSDEYGIKEQKVKTYEDMKFEEVIPEVAKEIKSKQDFDRFLTGMAEDIEGSFMFPVSEIREYKISFFAQFTFSGNSGDQYQFSIGGKKHREAVKTFLKEQLGKS